MASLQTYVLLASIYLVAHIYATCYPYWMLKPVKLLVKKDCNLTKVLGYEEGCYKLAGIIFKLANVECVDDWLKYAVWHMKNLFTWTYTD